MRPEILAEHLAAQIKALVEPLAQRVADLEARAPVPGPEGPPGPAGPSGLDGKSWRDQFKGRYVGGKTYDEGNLVTEDGSTFICLADGTTGKPGAAAGWQLVAKRGDRGRDGGRS